jgi:hypothetical protein
LHVGGGGGRREGIGYDVASALPYAMDEHKLRFAMKVGRGELDLVESVSAIPGSRRPEPS